MFIIPKHFDVLHATAGSFPLLESRKIKLSELKKNMTQNTAKQIIYIQDRRTQRNSGKIRLENQTIHW